MALTAFLLVSGCAPSGEPEEAGAQADELRLVSGPCADVYGGEVCTFATIVGDEVTEFGATVPIAAIEAAPAEMEMAWPPQSLASIPLPMEVRDAVGFDHLGVNWEANGHPPGLFFTPHFDFHFYVTDPESVMAVDCSDSAKPGALPTGYALPDLDVPPIGMLVGLCVPLMGMHAMPAGEVEQTDPFRSSMIVGYYGGELTFLEPMVSRVQLMERQSFELDIPAPPEVPAGVRLPTSFRADYDEATSSYRLVFSGLTEM